ncbi:hypothetical protein H4N54_05985 [Limnospira fusiformis KN01]|uniref:Uncharacterized protein n=1 Tax=Limnospira maxima CS-328 TaxID=513049 RepID=B5VY04_LIMMA|nr:MULTISPECIES: hypothetical protein [Limnospira]EKD07643.1 hypothetical protein SPLC1_S370190 [Arthrospira platensis C1]MDC0838722.1 hypothetical protein [Limnoraphis robusta]MDY7055532.1 hypothetical protein [Limnospira fusiformis LS22]QJB25582.1 hypothetical protein HFV01_07005 [Limnospira fusiformis SAG 85.79]EDZ95706.1 hypothetical protein AmaxDRAFT_1396 [Limnospira maxima CS-328]
MNTQDIIRLASEYLANLSGHTFDILKVYKPTSAEAAVNLAKVISKLSPLLGNLIEFNTVELLNNQEIFATFGEWKRQDPGFPDTIFVGDIKPTPGLEIKVWFPLATEITARFKDSQNHFRRDQTYVALIAWLPEAVIYGRPKIIDVCVVSGYSIAKARDDHYHNPPDYLIIEPEDTTERTANLQQTNTNGYKFQGTDEDFMEAEEIVKSWGNDGRVYKPTPEYQKLLRELIAHFKYRLDTNFAKMDRIVHPEIESFKERIYKTECSGMEIYQWQKLLASRRDESMKSALRRYLGITEENIDKILD